MFFRTMEPQVPSFFSLAMVAGGIGISLLLLGAFLAKVFRTYDKADALGMTGARELSTEEQFTVFFRRPDISIPVGLLFFGGLSILGAIFCFGLGVITKILPGIG